MLKSSHRQKVMLNESIFLLFLFIIYILSSVLFLNQPGLCEDEAYHVDPILNILKNTPQSHLSIKIFGHNVFILLNAWTGPVISLLFLPSLYFFGFNIYAIRLTRIFYGFATIILLYFFAKKYFNEKVAKIASFLMATFPYYIFMYRHGYLDDGILPTFLLASLLCFYSFYKKGKVSYLYLGSFFSGLGVTSKLNFLWFLMALSISIIVLKVRIILNNKKCIVIALLIFAMTVSPFLVFNLLHPMSESHIIGILRDNLTITYLEHNNMAFYNNLKENLVQLKIIFNNITAEYYHNEAIAIPNPVYFYLFIFVIIFYVLRFVIKRKSQNNNKKVKLLLLVIIIMFFLKNYTVSILRIEHFVILLPLAILIIANFIVWVFKRYHPILGYSMIFIITVFNIISIFDTYRLLHRERITSMYHSSHPSLAIYSLCNYLQNEDIYCPVSVAPRLDLSLKILSKGKVKPITFKTEGSLNPFIDSDNSYFIASLDPYNKHHFAYCKDLIEKYNKVIVIDKIFFKKTNEPEILVFKLKDKIIK